MVVIAAGRQEDGTLALLLDLETEDIAPESERALDVGDLEVNMPDPRAGMDGTCGLRAVVHRNPRILRAQPPR
jgi:hypothetical protein